MFSLTCKVHSETGGSKYCIRGKKGAVDIQFIPSRNLVENLACHHIRNMQKGAKSRLHRQP